MRFSVDFITRVWRRLTGPNTASRSLGARRRKPPLLSQSGSHWLRSSSSLIAECSKNDSLISFGIPAEVDDQANAFSSWST